VSHPGDPYPPRPGISASGQWLHAPHGAPVEVPPSARFKLANRDIEEAVVMMDHPPVHRSCFILGMELAMRIVRNRARDLKETVHNGCDCHDDLETVVGMIRIVQVEVGSGRMEMPPMWTEEEIDEVRRIS
jgi:hypothetical protein